MWLSLFFKEYANRIADRQFRTALMKKVWAAWRSLSEENWKEKVEKAYQLRAEDVCVQLSNDYEAKIAEVKKVSFFPSFSPSLHHPSSLQSISLSKTENMWTSSRTKLPSTQDDMKRSLISTVVLTCDFSPCI